jgi:glycosyltransferase involved in cell wall biosynthesis
MRVVLFIDSLGSGGAQRQFIELCLGLHERRVPLSVLTYYPKNNFFQDQLINSGIHCISIDKSTNSFLVFHALLVAKLLQLRPTHIISFLEVPSFYSLLFKLISPSTSVIVSERASRLYGNYAKNVLRLLFFNLSDYVSCNSHNHSRWASSYILNSKRKVRTIYNSYSRLASTSSHNACFPKPVFARSMLKLISVGTITISKNLHNLLYALEHFHQQTGRGFTLNIYGRVDPDAASQYYYNYLINYISSSTILQDRVKHQGLTNDIYSIISASSALIHSSFHEGLPNVVCEAFFLRTPVLAANVCELPILIGNDKRGILFKPSSFESISNSIQKLSLYTDSQIHHMTNLAYNFAALHFSRESFLQSYYDMLVDP